MGKMNKQQQFNNNKSALRKLESIIEVAILTYLYYLAWSLFYRTQMAPYLGMGKWVLLGIYVVITLALLAVIDGLKFGHQKLSTVIISQVIALFISNLITYFQLCLMANHMLYIAPMLVLYIAEIIIDVVCSYLFTRIYHTFNVPQQMLMIYGNEDALTLKFKMDERQEKYRVTDVMSCFEDADKIRAEIYKHDSVIINDVPSGKRNSILKFCYEHGIRTYMAPKISDIIVRGAEEINLFDTPLLLSRGRGLSPTHRFVKRLLDIVLCSIAMIPFSIIWAIVAIAIKAEDGGPLFYRQTRITRFGREFEIIKFRSMIVDAEKGGYDMSMRATGEDPRITKVGKVIRKYRIDELPQILNILKGDMSIVGPRPERVENYEEYLKDIPEFALRNKVRAGLTGYAQVYGRYNTTAYDKLKMDLTYIENYSLILDVKLVFMTLQVMFKSEATEGFEKQEEMEERKRELISKKKANKASQ